MTCQQHSLAPICGAFGQCLDSNSSNLPFGICNCSNAFSRSNEMSLFFVDLRLEGEVAVDSEYLVKQQLISMSCLFQQDILDVLYGLAFSSYFLLVIRQLGMINTASELKRYVPFILLSVAGVATCGTRLSMEPQPLVGESVFFTALIGNLFLVGTLVTLVFLSNFITYLCKQVKDPICARLVTKSYKVFGCVIFVGVQTFWIATLISGLDGKSLFRASMIGMFVSFSTMCSITILGLRRVRRALYAKLKAKEKRVNDERNKGHPETTFSRKQRLRLRRRIGIVTKAMWGLAFFNVPFCLSWITVAAYDFAFHLFGYLVPVLLTLQSTSTLILQNEKPRRTRLKMRKTIQKRRSSLFSERPPLMSILSNISPSVSTIFRGLPESSSLLEVPAEIPEQQNDEDNQ